MKIANGAILEDEVSKRSKSWKIYAPRRGHAALNLPKMAQIRVYPLEVRPSQTDRKNSLREIGRPIWTVEPPVQQ